VTAVEVLAPLRLETRFRAPNQRDDDGSGWQLRLRIYPDEFSLPEAVPPPSSAELDRLTEALDACAAGPEDDVDREPVDDRSAFAAFAGSVGPARASHLWRTRIVTDADGVRSVDRTGQNNVDGIVIHDPLGLPSQLEVWFVHQDGRRELAETLQVEREEIAVDMDLGRLAEAMAPSDPTHAPPPSQPADAPAASDPDDAPVPTDPAAIAWAEGRLPRTWWLDHERAVDVGLAVDIELGARPPDLDALIVVARGDTDCADLLERHAASGRLAVLPPATSTNTVHGEATTNLGSTEGFGRLLEADPDRQPASRAVFAALLGRSTTSLPPLLGGWFDQRGPGAVVVQALWPVLWGRALRDVNGAGAAEVELARWAIDHLAVEGPLPAIRVGDQPYGLLPTSVLTEWVTDPDDPWSPLEERLVRWAVRWRDGAAETARTAAGRVHAATTRGLLDVLGQHAPNRHWRMRPIAPLHPLQAARAMVGMPPLPASRWDRDTARSLADRPYPPAPIGPAARSGRLVGPVDDLNEDAERWRELLTLEPGLLYHEADLDDLGLIGRLVRQALICSRAIVGEAAGRVDAGEPIDIDTPLALDDEPGYADHVLRGHDDAVDEILHEPNGDELADRFGQVVEGVRALADRWEQEPDVVMAAVLAALDTAAGRVDPWLLGVAHRRLEQLTAQDAPRYLGAYGWVDAPAPFVEGEDRPLAPGPTDVGLVHAPSDAQALTAAILRDAAVRQPNDTRWDLTVDSAKVRAAAALAERVSSGVHPYEALGLEVERIAGDWDHVRVLRKEYPLPDEEPERRVCDGAAVLRAAREQQLPAVLPSDLADRLQPLDAVLDTYADLLLADGVHAFATGRADLAQAAMEAAAGFGAPPELRAVRTPRAATSVHVAAWVVLPPGAAPRDDDTNVPAAPDGCRVDLRADAEPLTALAHPLAVADPAFVAFATSELGSDPTVTSDPASVERNVELAALLGGGEDEPIRPRLTGGEYEGLPTSRVEDAPDDGGDERIGADAALQIAVDEDLTDRLSRVHHLARRTRTALATYDPDRPGADDDLTILARWWEVDLAAVIPEDPEITEATTHERRAALVAALDDRLARVGTGHRSAAGSRAGIRELVGRPWLPVLPVVSRALLPTFHLAPDLDQAWLEVVAAVRPRLATLEARQLAPDRPSWPAQLAAPDGGVDPWHPAGPVLVAYDPGDHLADGIADDLVAIAALDGWEDAVPSRRHVTSAAFGFNAPRSRAPQAVLLAVPPDPTERLTSPQLLDVVLETRQLVHARAARPRDRGGLPYATPAPIVHASGSASFLTGWRR
jgi:hypothetical protein